MKKINNNIKEKRVSFENAKLLKRAGFDIETIESYCSSNSDRIPVSIFPRVQQYKPNVKEEWYAPTQQLAIGWILINFQIHITITSISQESWQYHITKIGDSLGKTYEQDFYTPEEAKEAAITFVLTNML